MARSVFSRASGDSGEVSFNMTPMIDCVFQLIIFFILAGQVASQSLARVVLPEPQASQAQKWSEQDRNRVIVNVPSMAGRDNPDQHSPMASQAREYLIGGAPCKAGDADALVAEFQRRYQPFKEKNMDYFIEIRADKRVSYGDIQPILWAAGKAGIPKLNITALLPTK